MKLNIILFFVFKDYLCFSFPIQYLVCHVFSILQDVILLGLYEPRGYDAFEAPLNLSGESTMYIQYCRNCLTWHSEYKNVFDMLYISLSVDIL